MKRFFWVSIIIFLLSGFVIQCAGKKGPDFYESGDKTVIRKSNKVNVDKDRDIILVDPVAVERKFLSGRWKFVGKKCVVDGDCEENLPETGPIIYFYSQDRGIIGNMGMKYVLQNDILTMKLKNGKSLILKIVSKKNGILYVEEKGAGIQKLKRIGKI